MKKMKINQSTAKMREMKMIMAAENGYERERNNRNGFHQLKKKAKA